MELPGSFLFQGVPSPFAARDAMFCLMEEYTDWMNFAGISRQRSTALPSLSRDVIILVFVSKDLKSGSGSERR